MKKIRRTLKPKSQTLWVYNTANEQIGKTKVKRRTQLVLDEVIRRERLKKIKLVGVFVLLIVFCGSLVGYSQFRHVETTAIASVLQGVLEAEHLTINAAGQEKRVFSVRLNDKSMIKVSPSAAMFFKEGFSVSISKQDLGPGRVQYGFIE